MSPTSPGTPAQFPSLSVHIPNPTPILPADTSKFRIGFVTPPFRDTKIPVADHLHAHAYVEPADLMGWWRSLAYSPVAWYAIDDLIAEIRYVSAPGQHSSHSQPSPCVYREETSNNRVRSSMPKNIPRPIDHVPTAGARSGHANGAETTEIGLGAPDANLEDGDGPLSPRFPPEPSQDSYDTIDSPTSPPLNYMPGHQDSSLSPTSAVSPVRPVQIPAASS